MGGMRTLTRAAHVGHHVRCRICGYDAIHPDVRDAVNDYVDHQCPTTPERAESQR